MWVFALPDNEPTEVGRPQRPAAPTRSLSSGVFTAEQAALGEVVYATHCSGCHEAENYTGANLVNRWGGATLADVYQDLSLTMPPVNPSGLTAEDYASILAYWLSQSGYPAGGDRLPSDAFRLSGMAIGSGSD
jgi:mono/diheme cytochrome c family protein